MRVITDRLTDPNGGPAAARGVRPPAVLAIGNFDGVHRGHQAVLRATCEAARRAGLAAAALTFEPHPRSFFQPDGEAFRLSLAPLKARRLGAIGLDRLYVAAFDADLAALSAEAFARDALAETLSARRVIVGADFKFGRGRSGDLEALRRFGDRFGFEVSVMDPVGDPPALGVGDDEGGAAVFSSSAVRRALRSGDPLEAARILGDWHRIEGRVERGDQRGRTLGFPTANLSLDGVLQPAFGVYAVQARIRDGAGVYPGVASLGLRPQFDKTIPNFETHLFDFEGDLYGAEMSVALIRFLRPEARFESVEALVAQMERDSAEARRLLEETAAPWRR